MTSYPVREQYGLIWVWPSAGPAAAAEAAAAALPLSRGVLKAAEKGQYLRWYRRELEYSWDILIENLTDPCEYWAVILDCYDKETLKWNSSTVQWCCKDAGATGSSCIAAQWVVAMFDCRGSSAHTSSWVQCVGWAVGHQHRPAASIQAASQLTQAAGYSMLDGQWFFDSGVKHQH